MKTDPEPAQATAAETTLPETDPIVLKSESDVEQKFMYPFLAHPGFLHYPANWIKTKSYVPPTDIDKGAGKKYGYVPDYTIWHAGFPLVVIEAKSPDESAYEGLREARLYAIEINKRYPANVNPIFYIIGTNGRELLINYWDSEENLSFPVQDLNIGTSYLDTIRDLIGFPHLIERAKQITIALRPRTFILPVDRIGGRAVLSTPLGLNSFADDLLPLVGMYFGVEGRERTDEIVRRAYVSSDETTKYHATLEAYLRDNVSLIEKQGVQPITTTRTGEEKLTRQISQYTTNPNFYGRLQLLIGAVGAGKSTFMERYYSYLMPSQLRKGTLWSFVNFNNAPDDLSNAERWVCETFITSFVEKNQLENLYDMKNLHRIFATDINRRDRGPYAVLKRKQPEEYERRLAADVVTWIDDPINFAKNICRYFIGDSRQAIVVILDNVDRRDRDQQLRIFQIAQWFRELTHSFCVLSLRDVTFEAYKNEPPLNAFLNALNFYIRPPRFTDVVRKRLQLAMEFLADHSDQRLSYQVETGIRITYPATNLGKYLVSLFNTLFHTRRQVAAAIESLTGRDVRRALGMFADLIVSKHLPESEITRIIQVPGYFDITEATIIRILMRTRYRFFAEANGYVTNVLDAPPTWRRPSNFLYAEILEFLIANRKAHGDIRIEGYFNVNTIIDRLQKLGFAEDDIFAALEHLLERGLVVADHQRARGLAVDDTVKVTASGFMHLRFLCRRAEYLASILPATHIASLAFAQDIADNWHLGAETSDIRFARKRLLAEGLLTYLTAELDRRSKQHPFFAEQGVGSRKLVAAVQEAVEYARLPNQRSQADEVFEPG
jgi:hypothetical protein